MLFIYLYLINLYIRPQDWIPGFYGLPVDYLVIIPALIFGLTSLKANKERIVFTPFIWLMLLLLVIDFESNAVHGYFFFGMQQLILFSKKVCIFLIVLLFVKSVKNLKHTICFIVYLSAFIAGQALLQYFSGGLGLAGQDFYHSGVGIRTQWVGLWNGSNVLALLFNIALPFALEFSFKPYSLLNRRLNMVLVLILLGGIYSTNSRGGFITTMVILFLYPLFRIKRKKVAIVLGVICALLMLIRFSPSRMSEINTSEESAYIRTRLWDNSMEMFKQYPFLGVGKGKFLEHKENPRRLMAHSNFMQNLAETGIIGIFLWLALIYFSLKGLYQIGKIKTEIGSKEDTLKSLSRALFISLIGFNVCTLFVTMEIDVFYLLLGLCAAAISITNKYGRLPQLTFRSIDVRNIGLMVLGFLLFYHIYIK